MTTIAFDPGGTTGVAMRLDDGYHTLIVHRPKDLWTLIQHHKPEVVVFEDFTTAGRVDKNGLHTIRLIGGIQAIAWSLNIPTIVQYPPERNQFINEARSMLQALPHKWLVHELDALAHLLLYEHRCNAGTLDHIMKLRRTNEIGVNHE